MVRVIVGVIMNTSSSLGEFSSFLRFGDGLQAGCVFSFPEVGLDDLGVDGRGLFILYRIVKDDGFEHWAGLEFREVASHSSDTVVFSSGPDGSGLLSAVFSSLV